MNRPVRFVEQGIAFVFLVAFAGSMWAPDTWFLGTPQTPAGGSNIYDFLEFAALLPFVALGLLAQRRELPGLALAAWPALALVLFAFLSAFWSDDPALVVRRGGTVMLSTLLGIYLAARSDFPSLVATLVKVYALAAIASIVLIAAFPQVATMAGD